MRFTSDITISLFSLRSVHRTVDGANAKFSQESPKPRLGNLATHLKECKKYLAKLEAGEKEKEGDEPEYNIAVVRDMMAEFLEKGRLNPSVRLSQKGFLKIFALWILDEDLPWTTGEAPLLRDLFKYLSIQHQLPSDTTVRNELARIFADLHAKVVNEFSVSCGFLLGGESTVPLTHCFTDCLIANIFFYRYMDNTADDVLVRVYYCIVYRRRLESNRTHY